MSGIVIVVDIGNSMVGVSAWRQAPFTAAGYAKIGGTSLPTSAVSRREVLDSLRLATGSGSEPISSVLVCSVVPGFNTMMEAAVAEGTGLEALVLAATSFPGLSIRYDDAATLGADRVAAAAGARALFPRRDLVVVDVGTAATVDAVSASGEFLGGYILPGPGLWLSSLARGTALLAAAGRARCAEGGPGRNTEECVARALGVGYPATIRALIERASAEAFGGDAALTVGTGGAAREFEGLFDVREDDLVAIGALTCLS